MLPQIKDAVHVISLILFFLMVNGTEKKEWRSKEFLAWLYNDSNAPEDVVVNDRWGERPVLSMVAIILQNMILALTRSMRNSFFVVGKSAEVWEKSFGYNRNEGPEDYNTWDQLIRLLLICEPGRESSFNIGPRSDGTIPKGHGDRLKNWRLARHNGEAIYGTTVNRVTVWQGKVHFIKRPWVSICIYRTAAQKKLTIKGVNGAEMN
ncbi:hypothetical protein Ct9H90mP29_08040 [bacterium]|nr:MAG: hypothetical protein Ct9H90mP29_08040 [bacterium]